MGSRFVRPETAKLALSDGDWLIVRKRLTSGEQRAAYARMYLAGSNGNLRVDPLQTGMALIVAYLLDWSLTDDSGSPVVIRGVSADELTATLDNLSPEAFTEIKQAIEAHEEAMLAARAEEKKGPAPTTAADPTLSLPSVPGGGSSGFVN